VQHDRYIQAEQIKETVMSTRIDPVHPAHAQGRAWELLNGVKTQMGKVPNVLKTMAQAPALLDGYLALGGALRKGVLAAIVREQIALYVAQSNGCEYCLSAHSLTGKHAGLTPEQIVAARMGEADDSKAQAVLHLVKNLMERRGDLSDEQLAAARQAGLSDAELGEVVGNVALNTLTNYLNQLARTEVDFPRVSVKI
jgi:uncharacterized peroxidase-related enzyme